MKTSVLIGVVSFVLLTVSPEGGAGAQAAGYTRQWVNYYGVCVSSCDYSRYDCPCSWPVIVQA